MSSFRKLKQVLREAAGTYTGGIWVAGARTVVTAYASGQPVTMGQDLQALPEGRHMSDVIKFYTSSELNITADGEGSQPDIIVHNGYGYELVSAFSNQSDVINHFKYIGVKIFRFTSAAEWLSGTLKRS